MALKQNKSEACQLMGGRRGRDDIVELYQYLRTCGTGKE